MPKKIVLCDECGTGILERLTRSAWHTGMQYGDSSDCSVIYHCCNCDALYVTHVGCNDNNEEVYNITTAKVFDFGSYGITPAILKEVFPKYRGEFYASDINRLLELVNTVNIKCGMSTTRVVESDGRLKVNLPKEWANCVVTVTITKIPKG